MSEPATLPEWATALPDDIKPIVQAKGWKEPADMAKSYANLEKTLGQKRLPAPSADWKPEQWQSLYKELGLPDSPDKYTVPEVKLPDGLTLDATKMSEAKKALHEAGLLPQQAEKVLKYYFGTISKEYETAAETRRREQEASEFKLKDEWKGEYDGNVKLAKDALAKFGGPELVEHLNTSGLGNHPALIKAFAAIGKGMLEDQARGKGGGGGSDDVALAKEELAKLTADKEFMAKFWAGNKEAMAKRQELLRKIHGTEPIKS